MTDLIDRTLMQNAMEAKMEQLAEYRRTLEGRDDEIGKHARAFADGRIAQLDADMALLSHQPKT